MTAQNLEAIKEALLAELGRARQDELPLSDRAKRPTYLPGRSKTSHIPQARKENLESKWGTKIVDEESQQMEGLELGNARPWAKLTNHFMARHAAESAPPRSPRETMQFRPLAIPKPPSSIRPSGNISKVPKPILPPAPKTQASRSIPATRSAAAASNSKAPVAPKQTKAKPTPSAPLQIQEHVLSQGDCEAINESDNSSSEIKFMLKVQLQKNKGSLAIQLPDKSVSTYDVLTLGAPVLQGPFCLISNAQGDCLYKLKFRTSVAAEGFQYLLKSLQESALLFRDAGLVSPNKTPAPTAKKGPVANKTPAADKTPATNKETEADPLDTPKTVSQVTEPAPKTDHADEKALLQTLASIETPLSESLVDTEDNSPPNPAYTIEAAADHMQGLVQQILSEITAAGIQVPEKGIEEIESTAISNWMAQGFMATETESDELKEELAELLRILVRIKRRVKFRHGSSQSKHVSSVTISSETLRDLQEIVENPGKKIKYTPTDIKELQAQAVSRKDKINASGLHEIQKGLLPKRRAGSSIAKQEDQVPSSSLSMAAGGLVTSRWASPSGTATPSDATSQSRTATPSGIAKEWIDVTPKAAKASTTPKSQKPNPKGLSSSRWAEKPVENEGKFAGL